MTQMDLILSEDVIVRNDPRFDGAPDGYWQLYDDDKGPFSFPIPSPMISKRIGSPNPVVALFLRRLRWFFVLLAGVSFAPSLSQSMGIVLLLLLLVAHVVWSWFLIRGVLLLFPSPSPSFNRLFRLSITV